jgi:hypothetical protein
VDGFDFPIYVVGFVPLEVAVWFWVLLVSVGTSAARIYLDEEMKR